MAFGDVGVLPLTRGVTCEHTRHSMRALASRGYQGAKQDG